MHLEDTMTVTKQDNEDIRIVERKIIRTTLGPTKVGGNEYRRNEILQELIGEDIVRKIKKQGEK